MPLVFRPKLKVGSHEGYDIFIQSDKVEDIRKFEQVAKKVTEKINAEDRNGKA